MSFKISHKSDDVYPKPQCFLTFYQNVNVNCVYRVAYFLGQLVN